MSDPSKTGQSLCKTTSISSSSSCDQFQSKQTVQVQLKPTEACPIPVVIRLDQFKTS